MLNLITDWTPARCSVGVQSNRMEDSKSTAPTRTGRSSGRDPSTGMTWAFESPEEHWAHHDRRQLEYWRTRSPEERLAQAAEYRYRQHGDIPEPAVWTWQLRAPYKP